MGTSMNVGSLVTLIAAVHYFYMREYWIKIGTSPIVYRYIDWSLTVPLPGFVFGMCGWFYILYEIFYGEAGQIAGKDAGVFVASAFSTMRFIVTVGWSIYPLGYLFGYLMSAVNPGALNLVYNLADMVNKIAFCLAIWHAAKMDTQSKQGMLR